MTYPAMARLLPLLAMALAAAPAWADLPDPGETAPPIFNLVVKHPSPPPAKPSPMSPMMQQVLAHFRPKYDPSAASKPAPAPLPVSTDPSVVKMAAYHVREDKLIILDEEHLYTEDTLTKHAIERYLSPLDILLDYASYPMFFTSPQAQARSRFQDDQMGKRLRQIDELWNLERVK